MNNLTSVELNLIKSALDYDSQGTYADGRQERINALIVKINRQLYLNNKVSA